MIEQHNQFDDWPTIPLGEICGFQGGSQPPKSQFIQSPQNGYVRLLQIQDFKTDEYAVYVPDTSKLRKCTKNDVLIGRYGASVGKILRGKSGAYNVAIVKTIPDTSRITKDYLYFFLQSGKFQHRIIEASARAAQAGFNKDDVNDIELSLPPIEEQRRIVTVLDEKLVAVAQAHQAAQSQLEAAQALPAAYLRAIFDSPEAQSWPRHRLGDVLIQRREIIHPRNNPRGKATFVGLEHIESGTGVRIGSLPVQMEELTGRKPKYYKNDIVYGYLRPYLNKVWIAEFDGLCSVDQYVYSVNADLADVEFVAWFMRSSTYLKRAPIGLTPGQLPRIRTEEVAAVEINLPSLDKQKEIALLLTRKMKDSDKVVAQILEQIDFIEKLPASYLRQAFSGEL